MPHSCKALVLHCIDFRFGKAIKKYLESQNLLGDVDIVSVAGAVKDLVEPKIPADAKFIMRQIVISSSLHHISQVILLNHTDCGAYGGRAAFSSDNEEFERHSHDLQTAKTAILAEFPSLDVIKILARLNKNGEITFETII